jgi:hypothetical protein
MDMNMDVSILLDRVAYIEDYLANYFGSEDAYQHGKLSIGGMANELKSLFTEDKIRHLHKLLCGSHSVNLLQVLKQTLGEQFPDKLNDYEESRIRKIISFVFHTDTGFQNKVNVSVKPLLDDIYRKVIDPSNKCSVIPIMPEPVLPQKQTVNSKRPFSPLSPSPPPKYRWTQTPSPMNDDAWKKRDQNNQSTSPSPPRRTNWWKWGKSPSLSPIVSPEPTRPASKFNWENVREEPIPTPIPTPMSVFDNDFVSPFVGMDESGYENGVTLLSREFFKFYNEITANDTLNDQNVYIIFTSTARLFDHLSIHYIAFIGTLDADMPSDEFLDYTQRTAVKGPNFFANLSIAAVADALELVYTVQKGVQIDFPYSATKPDLSYSMFKHRGGWKINVLNITRQDDHVYIGCSVSFTVRGQEDQKRKEKDLEWFLYDDFLRKNDVAYEHNVKVTLTESMSGPPPFSDGIVGAFALFEHYGRPCKARYARPFWKDTNGETLSTDHFNVCLDYIFDGIDRIER